MRWLRNVFETLVPPVRLWRALGVSLLLHGLLALLLVTVRVALPAPRIGPERMAVFVALPRSEPIPVDPARMPERRSRPILFSLPPAHPRTFVPGPPPELLTERPPPALPPVLAAPSPPLQPIVRAETPIAVPLTQAPVKPALPIRTGVFSRAAPLPPASGGNLQTTLGAFEVAGVPGANGTGRAAAGRVALGGSGFGDASGRILGNGTGPSHPVVVRSGGFGEVVAAPAAVVRPRPPAEGNSTTALEILFKPRPAYTEAARRRRIEGEVVLEVLFTASGEVRVLRVLRGLGEGLDENAVQAARQIRFQAARRDGRLVDSTATVHITFQLAY